MEKNKEKDNGFNQLVIIIILSLAFLVLMFFSVSNSNITKTYNFNDDITINSLVDLENYNFGNLSIKNDGFLTSRVKISTLVLCFDILNDQSFNLEYYGEKVKKNYNDISSIYSNYIDISSNEELILDININYYDKFNLVNQISKNQVLNLNSSVYIYNNQDDYIYDYCKYYKKEEALKEIKVNFNISKEEINNYLKNDKIYY